MLMEGKPKHSDKGAPLTTSVSVGKAAGVGGAAALLNEKVDCLGVADGHDIGPATLQKSAATKYSPTRWT
jgi:hypothetical protein